MGRAARAKERRGNPVVFVPTVRYVSDEAFNDASRLGRFMRVTFGDREYVMDKAGTLRRTRPTAQTFSTRRPDQ